LHAHLISYFKSYS